MKSHHKKSSSPSVAAGSPSRKEINPPRLHRDMRIICDVFRISEQSNFALRSFDAATLEDFSLMTDEDFADMVLTQARVGTPLPPLQQRKLRVLLTWVRSLEPTQESENTEAIPSSPNKSEGFELRESKRGNGDILKASYKTTAWKGGGKFIPTDWETKFYSDLPHLKEVLRRIGGKRTSSNWVIDFLSLRWIVCG